MAATDYVIAKGIFNAFLVKKTKPTKKGPKIMSRDRRPITENEIIGLFEFYLRQWCDDNPGEDTVYITNDDGKLIFKATLLDKDELNSFREDFNELEIE